MSWKECSENILILALEGLLDEVKSKRFNSNEFKLYETLVYAGLEYIKNRDK